LKVTPVPLTAVFSTSDMGFVSIGADQKGKTAHFISAGFL